MRPNLTVLRAAIAPRINSTATEEVGGRTDTVAPYDHSPAETDVEIGDTVSPTSTPTDPSLANVEFTVTGVDLAPWAPARYRRAERRT